MNTASEEDIVRISAAFSLLAFLLISVESLRGKLKANIISHIKRDRPPDVEGACAL